MSERLDLIKKALFNDKKVYEKDLRIKCLTHVPRGKRHFGQAPDRIRHRFPIKDGISMKDMVIESVTRTNKLLEMLMERSNSHC